MKEYKSFKQNTLDELISIIKNTPIHILVVEENTLSIQVISRMLKKAYIQYDLAYNGKQALQKLGKNVYSIVLMDIQISLLDGFETTKLIRTSDEIINNDVSIIALTEHAMPVDEKRWIDSEIDAYISKPIKFEELIRIILKVYDKKEKFKIFNKKELYDRCCYDMELIELAVNGLINEFSGFINKLIPLIKENNKHDIKELLHSFKSNSLNAAAEKLTEHIIKMEKRVNNDKKLSLSNIDILKKRFYEYKRKACS